MNKDDIKVIAFYLPQYHPIRENSEWFGEGFTEWTNVGKAKPLFRNHYQPRVPADLGYYDLRIPEVRERQAELAKEAGVSAFCYYHYWFGNGRQIMEMPINEVIKDGKPDFPFCLCWANHSFYKKHWNADTNNLDQTLLLKQEYPGDEDIRNHFYSLLPIFEDKRYYRVDNKLVFVIYNIDDIPALENFFDQWQKLASKEGIGKFLFLSYTTNADNINKYPYNLTDGVILSLLTRGFKSSRLDKFKIGRLIKMVASEYFKIPLTKAKYVDAYPHFIDVIMREEKVIPSIVPNFDTTPRKKQGGIILHDCEPKYFRALLKETVDLVKNKSRENRLIFIKSWNEWGEGNYLEPDLKYGKGYLDAMKEELKK